MTLPDIREQDAPLLASHVVTAALAEALADPWQRGLAESAADGALVEQAWKLVSDEAPAPRGGLARGELVPETAHGRALARWLSRPAKERADTCLRVFGLVMSRVCPPHEVEFCHWQDPTYRAHHLADVAGFYRAFGVETDPAHPERADHVAFEIEFVALVELKQAIALGEGRRREAALCRRAHRRFIRDHATWWMPTFGASLEHRIDALIAEKPGRSVAAALRDLRGTARALRAWMAIERSTMRVDPPAEIAAPSVDPPGDAMVEGCGSCTEACPGAGRRVGSTRELS